MAAIQILLVDDHAVVRAGYRMLLQGSPDMQILAEAQDGESACREYQRVHPDVVIMDLSLPGISGLEAIRRIVARDPNARILAFSIHSDMVFVEQALQAGARGYITKSSAPEVLVDAVKRIAAGQAYLEGGIAQTLAYQKTRGKSTAFEALSTREFEIVCLLAEGNTIEDISRRLSLSYKTVANYNTQIKSKLNVSTIAELTRLAIRHGLVSA